MDQIYRDRRRKQEKRGERGRKQNRFRNAEYAELVEDRGDDRQRAQHRKAFQIEYVGVPFRLAVEGFFSFVCRFHVLCPFKMKNYLISIQQ